MKTKKMFLLFAAFIFAAVAGYNIHLAQNNQNSDISLADIVVMAQADGESGGTLCVNCKVVWVRCPDDTLVIRCRLGGDGCWAEWQDLC